MIAIRIAARMTEAILSDRLQGALNSIVVTRLSAAIMKESFYSVRSDGDRLMRTVGLRIKSGFAIAIVAVQESESWRIERRAEVQLALDEGPYGRFPYHPLIELKGAKAAATSRRAVAAVRAVARKQMSAFLKSIGAVDGATLIVGSLIDPSTIGNPHIRTHAREGELFRGVVARALERKGIRLQILRERDLY